MLNFASSDRVFVLTGAGVSAESGLPTFRGVGGLLVKLPDQEVASPHAWHRDPRLVWEFYSMRRRVASAAKPNAAHFALAKLQNALQDPLFVCTQNVDNLHEQAGSRNVVHMHGELSRAVVTLAAALHLTTQISTIRRLSFPMRMRRSGFSPAHLLVWRSAIRIGRNLSRTRSMHSLHGHRNIRRGQEPAASFVAHVTGRARTIYIGPENPANASSFTECYLGRAGEILPEMFGAL